MKALTSRPTLIEWGIIGFGAWHSRDIFHAWMHSPKDRGSGILFLVWIFPFAISLLRCSEAPTKFRTSAAAIALVLILAGALGHLNALVYLGFAASVTAAAWSDRPLSAAAWLLGSSAWMPATTYVLISFPLTMILIIKIALLLPTIVVLLTPRKNL